MKKMTLKELMYDYVDKYDKYMKVQNEVDEMDADAEGFEELDNESDELYKIQWQAYDKLAKAINAVTGIDEGLSHTMVRCHFDRVKAIIEAWS